MKRTGWRAIANQIGHWMNHLVDGRLGFNIDTGLMGTTSLEEFVGYHGLHRLLTDIRLPAVQRYILNSSGLARMHLANKALRHLLTISEKMALGQLVQPVSIFGSPLLMWPVRIIVETSALRTLLDTLCSETYEVMGPKVHSYPLYIDRVAIRHREASHQTIWLFPMSWVGSDGLDSLQAASIEHRLMQLQYDTAGMLHAPSLGELLDTHMCSKLSKLNEGGLEHTCSTQSYGTELVSYLVAVSEAVNARNHDCTTLESVKDEVLRRIVFPQFEVTRRHAVVKPSVTACSETDKQVAYSLATKYSRSLSCTTHQPRLKDLRWKAEIVDGRLRIEVTGLQLAHHSDHHDEEGCSIHLAFQDQRGSFRKRVAIDVRTRTASVCDAPSIYPLVAERWAPAGEWPVVYWIDDTSLVIEFGQHSMPTGIPCFIDSQVLLCLRDAAEWWESTSCWFVF